MQNGHAVVLVEALRYTPEGRGFYSRWEFFITYILPASNSNKYRGYSWGCL